MDGVVKRLRRFAPKDKPWVYRLDGTLIATDGVAAAAFAGSPGPDGVFDFDLKPVEDANARLLGSDFLTLLNDYEVAASGTVKVADLRRALRDTRGWAVRLYAEDSQLLVSGTLDGEVGCRFTPFSGRGVLYVCRQYFAKALALGIRGEAVVVIPRQAKRPRPFILRAGPWSVYIAPLAYWPPVPLPVLEPPIGVAVGKDEDGTEVVVSRLGLKNGEGQIELALPPGFASALGRWLLTVRPFFNTFAWPEGRSWQPGGKLLITLYPMLKDNPDRCGLVIQYYARTAVCNSVEMAWDELRSWGQTLCQTSWGVC